MANTSIYAAFERMWSHIINKLSDKVSHSDDPVFALEDSEDIYADAINADTLQGHVAAEFVRVLDTSANTETAPLNADTFGGRTPDEYATQDELNALTADDVGAAPAGYGLGEAELISMADIDSITYPGWYYSNESATLGGYTSNRWWMQVLAYGRGTTFATQRLITFNSGCGYELVRHKINGTWGEWEWVNPPLSFGVEYRTTERYNEKPVYVKCVNYGHIAEGTTTIEHGISDIDDVVGLDIINRTYGFFSNSAEVHSAADRTNVSVTSAWAMGGLVYIIKYTKG